MTPQVPDFESSIQENNVEDFGEKENNSLDNQQKFHIEKDDKSLYKDRESLDENDWDSSTKFHFAMSSQWHEGKTHKVTLEKTNLSSFLSSWLEGCVKYIQDQLKHVDR